MKLLCNILTFLFFIPLSSFGAIFKNVDKKDLNVYTAINLSIGYKDYLISPLVFDNLDLSTVRDNRLKDLGFEISSNQIVATDTLIIDKNDFFEVVSVDSILKFSNCNYRLNDSMIISEPFYYYLALAYKKKCICHFSKIQFSKNSEYAIAEYFIGCGMNDGMGKRLLLKRTKEKWIIIDTLSILGS